MGSTLPKPSLLRVSVRHREEKSDAVTMKLKEVETKEEFDTLIRETKTLVVVDFFATWCGPCKAIAPQLETWASEYEGEILFLKVDVDKNEEAAEAANVSAMPTFHFYKDGQKIDEVVGANKGVLEEKIKNHK